MMIEELLQKCEIYKIKAVNIMAGFLAISLLLIVGKTKCDAQASVKRRFCFFYSIALYNTILVFNISLYPIPHCTYSLDPQSGISIGIIV